MFVRRQKGAHWQTRVPTTVIIFAGRETKEDGSESVKLASVLNVALIVDVGDKMTKHIEKFGVSSMQGLQCQICCDSSWLVSVSLEIGGFVEKEILCWSTVSKIGGLVHNRWVAAVPGGAD